MFWTEEYHVGKNKKIELSRGDNFLRINECETYKKVEDLSVIEQINEKSARWGDPYEGTNYYIQMQLNSKGSRLANIRIILKNEARRIHVLSGFFEGESFKVIPHSGNEFTYYTRCKKEEVEK